MPSKIVRATGVCCRCDSRFRDELVLAVCDPRVPSGVVFIELRHLTDVVTRSLSRGKLR